MIRFISVAAFVGACALAGCTTVNQDVEALLNDVLGEQTLLSNKASNAPTSASSGGKGHSNTVASAPPTSSASAPAEPLTIAALAGESAEGAGENDNAGFGGFDEGDAEPDDGGGSNSARSAF